jgi:hypothetical protein
MILYNIWQNRTKIYPLHLLANPGHPLGIMQGQILMMFWCILYCIVDCVRYTVVNIVERTTKLNVTY